jgi:hypothetical protein
VRGLWGGVVLPIRRFLDRDVFEQETIDTMSAALTDACRELGLNVKDDAAVRLLALRIIKEAKQGIRDRALLKQAALRGLRTSH